MTFLELTTDDARDLALDLYYAGDCPDLDSAAAMAVDMQAVLATVAEAWDQDAGYLTMPEGDVLGPDGLRV